MKPTIATTIGFMPDLARRNRSVSMPTSNSSRMMPISASSVIVASGDTQPSSDGPTSKPASSSPITDGTPWRPAISENSRAAIRMMARVRKELVEFHASGVRSSLGAKE